MIEIIISIVLILLASILYITWIKPVKTMKSYIKLLRSLGYKVYENPYNPLKDHMFYSIQKGNQKGDSMQFYKEMGAQYDVVVSNQQFEPLLEFYHPDFIKDFFSVDKHYDYPKEEKVLNFFTRVTGKGLIFSEGQVWKRKRTILNNIFNFNFVKAQTTKVSQITSDAIKQLQAQGKKNLQENTVTYNILDLTLKIFSEVMMQSFLGGMKNQVIMGKPAGTFLKQLFHDINYQSLDSISYLFGAKIVSLGFTASQRNIQSRIREYRRWGQQFIRKRIKQINQKIAKGEDSKESYDITEAFLRAKLNAKNQNEETITSQAEIFEEFSIFFAAGTDTSSSFGQSLIYSVAKHPQVERKVREEISTFMKNDDYSYENLKNLTYIDNVQKEAMRWYGPAPLLFERKAKVDNYLNGVPVRKGTMVSIMQFGNHFSEKYFKSPNQFRPERWESQCNDLPPFLVGGFSGGARTCIGKHLALLETKIALIKFMKRYNKIDLPKKDFQLFITFSYGAEDFETTMTIDPDSKL